MKRIENIVAEVRQHKTCSKRQVQRYMKLFNIKPVGVRQIPRLYPDDATERILKQLGLVTSAGCGVPGCPNAADPAKQEHILSMPELCHERSKRARRAA